MLGLGPEVTQFDIFYHTDETFEYDHATSLFLKSKISEDIWNNYYKFAIIRNPYDRLVSEFFWKKKDNDKRVIDCSDISFSEFITYLYNNFDSIMSLPHKDKSHFIKQSDFILPDVEIFRFVNMNDTLKNLSDRFNINPHFVIENKTQHDWYEQYYNTKLKNMVYEMYYCDFILHNHCK
jgi:hypothetical protein